MQAQIIRASVAPPSVPHGFFAFADSSETLTMTQNLWASITNATNTLFTSIDATNVTFAGDSLTINIDRGGDYVMIASVSFSGSAADSYEFAFFKNNTITNASSKMERSTSQTDVGNVGIPIYIESLTGGDDITLKIRNTASNDNATIVSCSWITWRLHR